MKPGLAEGNVSLLGLRECGWVEGREEQGWEIAGNRYRQMRELNEILEERLEVKKTGLDRINASAYQCTDAFETRVFAMRCQRGSSYSIFCCRCVTTRFDVRRHDGIRRGSE